MNKQFNFIKAMCCAVICVFVLSGCSGNHNTEENHHWQFHRKNRPKLWNVFSEQTRHILKRHKRNYGRLCL